ncbi:MAG: alpha/beta fold hydrolase, partial [Litorimonas sp.]
PDAGVRAALRAMHADPETVTDDRVAQYGDLMTGQGKAFVARAEQFTLPDPAAAMARITAPTTIVWGAQDAVLPSDHGAVFARHIPDAEVIVLDGVGHLPQAEATAEVAQVIRDMAGRIGASE